jgi:hypothetical protein
MRLKFGDWLPDLADFENPGSTLVKNVIPFQGSYLPVQSVSQISDALNARCRGAISARDKTGQVYSYAGNETKLYELSGNVHADVTNTGGAYALNSEENWEFAKYGEKIIAVNIDENPQVITFADANFADLAGSPPKARAITIANEFIVLGNINDGTARPQRIQWSALGNSESWTPDADTQADFQDLYSEANHGGGWVQSLIGTDQGFTVICEYTMFRGTYVGSPKIFDIVEVNSGVGTPCKNSIIKEGRLTHFLGQDGFYQLIDGTQLKPISDNRVSKYFLNDYDSTYPERVIGAQDPVNKIVAWIYPGAGNSSGTPNQILFYDWINDKWGNAEIDLEWIYNAIGQGVTVEQLDSYSASIDTLSPHLDSRFWKGGALQLAIYDSAQKKGTLGGTALDAIIETNEAQAFEGSRSYLSGVRPLVDGSATQTVQVGTRDLQTGTTAWTSAVSPETDTGIAPFRSDARYHRIRVNTSGDFDHCVGVDIFAQPTGKR